MGSDSNSNTSRLEVAFATATSLGLIVWFTGAHEIAGDFLSDLRSYGPQQCAGIGEVCPDGSVYTGRTPDGNMFMFATPEDAPRRLAWSAVPAEKVMESCGYRLDSEQLTESCFTGQANTASLAKRSGVLSSHAAGYCAALEAHGRDDWYLPAIKEIGVLFRNSERIGGFKLSHEWSKPMQWDARFGTYWSSSEREQNTAVARNFAGLSQEELLFVGKHEALLVRCVRSDPVPE